MKKKDNTITASNGIKVYLNEFWQRVDEYIELEGKPTNKTFMSLILYIKSTIHTPEHNPETLNPLFDCFVSLCAKYEQLPTLQAFAVLIGSSSSTFSDWGNGEYNAEMRKCVKRWKDVCCNFLVNDLTNSASANVSKIFIAKAAYGMTDSPQPEIEASTPHISVRDLPRLGESRELPRL